jgi:hypothetical protein
MARGRAQASTGPRAWLGRATTSGYSSWQASSWTWPGRVPVWSPSPSRTHWRPGRYQAQPDRLGRQAVGKRLCSAAAAGGRRRTTPVDCQPECFRRGLAGVANLNSSRNPSRIQDPSQVTVAALSAAHAAGPPRPPSTRPDSVGLGAATGGQSRAGRTAASRSLARGGQTQSVIRLGRRHIHVGALAVLDVAVAAFGGGAEPETESTRPPSRSRPAAPASGLPARHARARAARDRGTPAPTPAPTHAATGGEPQLAVAR